MLEAVFVYEMIDPLSIHVSFSEIITFLSPDTHTYAFHGTKKCEHYGKFCVCTK